MTWFKVDDGLPEHPKLESLEHSPMRYMAAVTVWTIMGADCARRNTDGRVTRARLAKVLHCLGDMSSSGAEALVEAGMWETDGDDYRFHDWADYQFTKAEVDAMRRAKTERQRRWRKQPVDASTSASTGASTRSSRDAATGASQTASTASSVDSVVDAPIDASRDAPHARGSRPVPTRPDPRERESPTLTLVGGLSAGLVPLVRTQFERRFVAERGSPPSWSKKNVDLCQTIAAWLEAKGGDPTRVLDSLLDGFFREPWAVSKGFPLALLANDPAKFLRPPERPRDVSTGFCAPAPSNAFVPTSPDSVFGPEPKS